MKKIFLGFLVLCGFGMIGLGIYGKVNQTGEKPKDKDTLFCSVSQYQSMYSANIETSIEAKFKNNVVDTQTLINKYIFDNLESYTMMKQAYESGMSFEVEGVNSKTEFDDNNKTMVTTMEVNYSNVSQDNIDEDMPTDFEGLKKYYLETGYTCNGEKLEGSPNTNQNIIGQIYSINEKINGTNNIFEYKNYELDIEGDMGFAFIFPGELINKTDTMQNVNIHLKFYDANQSLIGDYQFKYTSEIDQSSDYWQAFVVNPNELSNPSFTIYNSDLLDGKTVNDIQYYSLENIIY